MPEQNGNLTLTERRALKPGAVVSWQSERMIAEQIGTVDAVGTYGTLSICDGAMVGQNVYCRLVSAEPMVATQPEVRGLDGEGVTVARAERHESQPEVMAPSNQLETKPRAASSEKAPVRHKGNKWTMRGDKRADRQAWLAAVRAVRERMERGESRTEAIAAVAPTCGVRLTLAAYGWWLRTLVNEGLLEKSRKTMPRRGPRAQTAGNGKAPAVAAMQAGVAEEMKRERDELQSQLDQLKEAYAKVNEERSRLTEEALQLRADRGALQRTLEDLQKAVAKGDVHSGAVRRMDLRQTLTETETLVRELAMQWLLADIGRQAAEGLVRILDRARKAEPVNDERRTEA